MPKVLRFEPGALGEYFDPVGGVTTSYSSTCSHCQKGTDFPSKRKMMDYVEICRGCMKLICLECAGKPCFPYEKRADQMETAWEVHQRLVKDGWRCY